MDGAVYPAHHLSRLRTDRGRPGVSVVVPLFNEEENLSSLWQRLQTALESTELDYEVVLVDDGSRDATPELLDALHDEHPQAVVVRLSRNFGHQAAVCAGPGACPGPGRRRHGRRPARPSRADSRAHPALARGARRRLCRAEEPQRGPVQAAVLPGFLSTPRLDQRAGDPARQRRLLPDGSPRRGRAQPAPREVPVCPRSPQLSGLSPGGARVRSPRPRSRPAQIHVPQALGPGHRRAGQFQQLSVADGHVPGHGHGRRGARARRPGS